MRILEIGFLLNVISVHFISCWSLFRLLLFRASYHCFLLLICFSYLLLCIICCSYGRYAYMYTSLLIYVLCLLICTYGLLFSVFCCSFGLFVSYMFVLFFICACYLPLCVFYCLFMRFFFHVCLLLDHL